jgi:protein phosphatase
MICSRKTVTLMFGVVLGRQKGALMIVVESKGITDVGRTRMGNEDSLFYDDEMGLYVVADGMGGHNAGEVASKIITDTFQSQMKRFGEQLDLDKLVQNDTTLSEAANRIYTTIQMANRRVFVKGNSDAKFNGMGSTVSVAYFTERAVVVANVGDSPVYLIRDGQIKLVSVLHTMMAEYEALAPHGAKILSDQFRHIITRGMGLKETVKPDIIEIPWFKNDIFILCSDGLTDMVAPEKIQEVSSEGSADKICGALVDLANKRGGRDNITVIVIKIVDSVVP